MCPSLLPLDRKRRQRLNLFRIGRQAFLNVFDGDFVLGVLAFEHAVTGYVFLAPWRDLKTCEWPEGYISLEMFVSNNPFCQAFGRRAGKEIHDVQDAN